ncbi:hypothetical protein ACJX0J_006680, partial [Zea mays]
MLYVFIKLNQMVLFVYKIWQHVLPPNEIRFASNMLRMFKDISIVERSFGLFEVLLHRLRLLLLILRILYTIANVLMEINEKSDKEIEHVTV